MSSTHKPPAISKKKTQVPVQNSGKVILSLQKVQKTFKVGNNEVQIIKGVSFDVRQEDFIVLFGPSGCGKSTVLNILLGLEPPTDGNVSFLGADLYSKSEDERAQLRKEEIGMVYQQSNWVRSLNVIENVSFPLTLRGMAKQEREQKARDMLKQVEMEHAAYQISSELSSGQQQRVSLARALVADPSLLVADEPTGNLDSKASREIMELFKAFNDRGKTVILVTHDLEYMTYASRSIHMTDGQVLGEYKAGDARLQQIMVSKRGGPSPDSSE
jgi:putative ABC transport system ATP-binding protein